MISVPLIDHLQNERVFASILYGAESQYPNSEITLVSTRYWPTLQFALYRQQSWNGAFTNPVDKLRYSTYLDEKGARVNADFRFHFFKTSYTLGLGSRFVHLKKSLNLGKCSKISTSQVPISFLQN